jgi:natural product biosynthesis luciferase-like monooxygenase protein
MSHKLHTLLIGTESLLIQCAEILLQHGHYVDGLVTATPLIVDWAQTNRLPLIEPERDLRPYLEEQPVDYLFSITNLALLAPEVLALPRRGAINFHDGPLPRYAGLHVTSWALLNRERQHGITWHLMDSRPDRGDILKQKLFPIEPQETAYSLNVKCYEAAIDTFTELVQELATDRVTRQRQDFSRRSYFSMNQRPVAAGAINWQLPAEAIAALVRALDFGPTPNPLGLAKLVANDTIFYISAVAGLAPTSARPGTITGVDKQGLRVATTTTELALSCVLDRHGRELAPAELLRQLGCRVGDQLPHLSPQVAGHLTERHQQLARSERFWLGRLATLQPPDLPFFPAHQGEKGALRVETTGLARQVTAALAGAFPAVAQTELILAGVALFLARLSQATTIDLALSLPELRQTGAGLENFFADPVPFRFTFDPALDFAGIVTTIRAELALVRSKISYARDLLLRYPELAPLRAGGPDILPIGVYLGDDPGRPVGGWLNLAIAASGQAIDWLVPTGGLDEATLELMQGQLTHFLSRLSQNLTAPVGQISLLSAQEREQLLVTWNQTEVDYPDQSCLHHLIEAQALRTPDAIALVYQAQALTYRQLESQANQLAHYLQKQGVGPGARIGIFMERSPAMVVALLGTLKAGAAYIPLDPGYPPERLAFMVEDAQIQLLLSQSRLRAVLPPHQVHPVQIDSDWSAIAAEATDPPASPVTAEDLSYIIYTSGSTGKPKGVCVTHRNVMNFFTGMDAVIPHDPPGVWLAVTSLSFDISVLELFWTLARGFKVVIQESAAPALSGQVHQKALARPANPRPAPGSTGLDFSLFYFASDEAGSAARAKYELLLEGAKFADQHGFRAVWTPERHFHAFGGLYPNPSVTGAAIAAVTQRVEIRAGSCVLPLHNPIRVAEEWAVVDNISGGRVGISFAAGWHQHDFVLRPTAYADRKEAMLADIEVVQRLWQGETIAFPGADGQTVPVATLPRPVQAKLPTWLTAAGNPETFRLAGERGYHLLTHLLGQSLDQLREKIDIYRRAWQAAGHPGQGQVTLMLHTFVSDDEQYVRQVTRQPLINYLRGSVGLIHQAAGHFPTFKQSLTGNGNTSDHGLDLATLQEDEMEALLEFAFNRYYESSGLFGTPQSCAQFGRRLQAIGVNEIACLIDFGIDPALVLENLPHLTTLMALMAGPSHEDYSLAGQIERHAVSHFQCTPSLAAMLVADPPSRAALSRLKTFLVGGEVLPVDLAATLADLVPGGVVNMYGPTETTVWSTSYAISSGVETTTTPIGRPLANTQIYLLDGQGHPVPLGMPGEVYIGGAGVAPGYLNRPELTAARFVPDPFSPRPGARLYRSGDLARYRPDGTIEFLGRLDHQVKIRGYRIELGEIEVLLKQHPTVMDAVVIVREDEAADQRLVAYLIPAAGQSIQPEQLRQHLTGQLPAFMVPAHYLAMPAFPQTPNRKIDRNAFPPPNRVRPAAEPVTFGHDPIQKTIAAIWQSVLGLERVGLHDNFFELGGHSLLAVTVHRQLSRAWPVALSITDIFRFPTIASLSDHLQQATAEDPEPGSRPATARGQARRELQQRQNLRQPRSTP